MKHCPAVLLLVLSLLTPACDLVVESDTELVLGNRGAAFGSGSTNNGSGLPAVRVQPRGTLIVEDADVFGGGTIIDVPTQVFSGSAGAGIFSDGGTVRVLKGFVGGGPSVLAALPENTPPSADNAGPAILARASRLEIVGGEVVGGEVVQLLPGPRGVRPAPAVAIEATDSTVIVTGGIIAGGAARTDPRSDGSQPSLFARTSQVQIRGGTFMGSVVTFLSDLDVFGGEFRNGISVLGTDLLPPETPSGRVRIFGGRLGLSVGACAEVHGGQILFLGRNSLRGRVLIFGTDLRFESLSLPRNTVRIMGTLEDGSPLDTIGSGQVSFGLAFEFRAPGEEGCPAS